jgi:hypothetical protein
LRVLAQLLALASVVPLAAEQVLWGRAVAQRQGLLLVH